MAAQGILAGRVALVTGASSGIGRATAILFAEQGARVVAADLNDAGGEETVATIRAAGGEATYVHCDVSVEADVAAMVQVAETTYGGLDAAFNNAGVSDFKPRSFESVSSDTFDRLLAVNLRGVWLCMKHEFAVMVPRKRGTIVNTSSVAGLTGTPKASPYTAAKHGVIGLTRAGAVEHGRNGIRVNAIAPGFTRSGDEADLRKMMGPGSEEMAAKMFAAVGRMVAAYPLGRMAEPREMAEAALWLSSAGSSYVTGHVLVVDGGITAQGETLEELGADW
jgi:NAD(P)-dependent dehydrogenase (short-subunit alcohol dehydrogenase family)